MWKQFWPFKSVHLFLARGKDKKKSKRVWDMTLELIASLYSIYWHGLLQHNGMKQREAISSFKLVEKEHGRLKRESTPVPSFQRMRDTSHTSSHSQDWPAS